MTQIPGAQHAAQNARTVLMAGEDDVNNVYRNVAVDAFGRMFTVSTPESVSVGASKTVNVTDAGAVLVLAADADRKGFLIKNQGEATAGSDTVYLGLTASLALPDASGGVDQGLYLEISEVVNNTMLDGYAGPVYALCNTGESTQLAVWSW